MTPGMYNEGITEEEMEEVYNWAKQFESKLKESQEKENE